MTELPPPSDLESLARTTGASPQLTLSFDPRDSIPLLLEVRGSAAYLRQLKDATQSLFMELRSNRDLISAVGQSVESHGTSRHLVPDFSKASLKKYAPAIQVLLHSLAHISSVPVVQDQGRTRRRSCVAVPLDDRRFKQGSELSELKVKHRAFHDVVIGLSHIRWLEFVGSYHDPVISERFSSRVRPRTAFNDWMLARGLIFHRHPEGWERATEIAAFMRLRVSHGDKRDTLHREPNEEEALLPELNASLRKQRVKLVYPRYLDFERSFDFKEGRSRYRTGGQKDLYRVFSEEDGRAGRLYGHWVQGVPSALRPHLTIDGQAVVELDFNGMQLALLYAHAGRDLPNLPDQYAVPGYKRDDMKLVLTRSVGTSGRSEAVQSIGRGLWRDGRRRAGLAEELYDAFWAFHARISPEEQGMDAAWAELQAKDSRLALRILSRLHREGVTAIPIHDSFIVKARHEAQLRAAMVEEFERVFEVGGVLVRQCSQATKIP